MLSLNKFLILHLGLGAALALAHALAFARPLILTAAHLAVLGGLFSASFLVFRALARLPRRFSVPLFAALSAASALFMLLFYALLFTANLSWGADPTLKLVLRFLPETGLLLRTLGYPPAIVWAALGLIAGLLVWAYARAAPALLQACAAPLPWRGLALATLYPLCLGWLFFGQGKNPTPEIWDQEPLLYFLGQHSYAPGPSPQAPPQGPPARKGGMPNVVIIVSDSLRPDHTGPYGYARPVTPFLDELARAGRLQKVGMALAQASESEGGITSIISAAQPLPGARRETGPGLPQALAAQGYETNFFLSGDHDWYGLDEHYGKPKRLYDGVSSRGYSINDDAVLPGRLEAMLGDFERPQFLYIHLMSTHQVGVLHPAFQRYHPMHPTLWERLLGEPTAHAGRALNLYDNRVLQADHFIGRTFSLLEGAGLLQNTLVFVTADHGESLGEHGLIGHSQSNYLPEIRIPLLIADPAGRRLARDFACQLDIAPTIMARLGLKAPPAWKGQSLYQKPLPRQVLHWSPRVPAHAALTRLGADGGLHRLLRSPQGLELYDIKADPAESNNLAAAMPQLTQSMEKALDMELAAKSPSP